MTKKDNRQSAAGGAVGSAVRRLGGFGVCLIALAAIAGSDQSANAKGAAEAAADDARAVFHHSGAGVPARLSSSFNLSSFPHERGFASLPFGDAPDNANGATQAALPQVRDTAASSHSRFRQIGDNAFRLNGGFLDLRGLLVDAAGDNDAAFDNFYKKAQLRLFSSLDDALEQTAEDTLTRFSIVEKAGVELQTELGGRKSNFGVNLIGSFVYSGDEEDHTGDSDYAVGWQLRGYGGKDDVKGGNAGIFYRGTRDGILWGVNAFADYEDGEYGEFVRYSFGAEWQNSFLDLAANYYLPETGEKRTGDDAVVFSRKGYDAKMRLKLPGMDYVRAAVDHYNFDGKQGTSAEAEEGIRYGVEVYPQAGLRFAVFYDDESEKFGGDFAYSHTIGEMPARHKGGEASAPDLFAPVWREHSQRIVLATIVPVAAPPVVPPTVGSPRIVGSFLRNVNAFVNNTLSPVYTNLAGVVTVSGGEGNYTYSLLSGSDPAFSIDPAGTLYISAETGGDKVAIIGVDDESAETQNYSVTVTVPAFAGRCSFLTDCLAFGYDGSGFPSADVARAMITFGGAAGVATVNGRSVGVIAHLVIRDRANLDASRRQQLQEISRILIEGTDMEGVSMVTVVRPGVIITIGSESMPGVTMTVTTTVNAITTTVDVALGINFPYGNIGDEFYGYTALDVQNRYGIDLGLPSSARCHIYCRNTQRHYSGHICSLDTTAGENCIPLKPPAR